MKRSLRHAIGLVSCCAIAVGAHAVFAHHSVAMFDMQKSITIAGTVTEVRWINPHVHFMVDAAAEGKPPDLWLLEETSPGNLVRSGWTRTAIKLGDHVSVDVHPLRDGAKGGFIAKMTLTATGQSYSWDQRASEKPGLQ